MADAALDRTLSTISELGLDAQLSELNTRGYATIKGVLNPTTIERAQDAVLNRVAETTGKRIDLATASEADFEGMTYLPYLLYDDPVFEEILLQEKPLALITYLLGESALLSSLGCHFKGPGGMGLPLHSDNGNGMPAPFPSYSQVANVNYALTPYSREAGALALVPNSHTLARQPTAREMVLDGDACNPKAISMDLEPGDAVVWHGNLWHGSFQRTLPGIRMNLAVYFCRQYIQPQENRLADIPAAVQHRQANNERFNVLLGSKAPYGWQKEGPDYAKMAANPRGLYD